MPTVSVIIISYNSGAERLQKALASLNNQTFTDFDIILFDNASTDGSIDTLPQVDRLRIIRNPENLGFAGGVNMAAADCTGEWLALLNPDAVAESDWLVRLMAATKRFPDASAFGSVQLDTANPTLLDGLGDVYHALGIAWRGGYGQNVALRPSSDMEIFAPCAAGALYRRRAFNQIGGMEESFFCYHEDVDLGFRLRLSGSRAILVSDAVIHHEGSGTTGRHSEFSVYHGTRNRVWTFIRNMPPLLFWPLLPLHILTNVLLLFPASLRGAGSAYAKGIYHGITKSGPAWVARRKIQQARIAGHGDIMRLLAWSPLALIERKPILRKPESES